MCAGSLGIISLFPVYVPNGHIVSEDLRSLFYVSPNFAMAGDFNVHHNLWETASTPKRCGHLLADILLNYQNISLATPLDLGARINPCSGSSSTIDSTTIELSFLPSLLSLDASISQGMGSDHLPITCCLKAKPARWTSSPPAWIIIKDKWNNWNIDLKKVFEEAEFLSLVDPEIAHTIFSSTLLDISRKCFRLKSQSLKKQKEPAPSWRNEECSRLAALARKSFRSWRNSPLSPTKRAEWSKAEAAKKNVSFTQNAKHDWISPQTFIQIKARLNSGLSQNPCWASRAALLIKPR